MSNIMKISAYASVAMPEQLGENTAGKRIVHEIPIHSNLAHKRHTFIEALQVAAYCGKYHIISQKRSQARLAEWAQQRSQCRAIIEQSLRTETGKSLEHIQALWCNYQTIMIPSAIM